MLDPYPYRLNAIERILRGRNLSFCLKNVYFSLMSLKIGETET